MTKTELCHKRHILRSINLRQNSPVPFVHAVSGKNRNEKSISKNRNYSFADVCRGIDAGVCRPTSATISALRMAGTITGGLMPSTAPEFATMVTNIQAGDYFDAAMAAVGSQYFSKYLVRRMAKEMMTPALSAAGIPDNDATTLIVANLVGSGTTANISKLWSDNSTYLITGVSGATGPMHVLSLTQAQLANVNWTTNLVQVSGQTANALDSKGNATLVTIPAMHVGGFMTASDRPGDFSIAQYGFTAGTNLRAIESLYEVSMGLTLPQLITMNGVKAQLAPRFIPGQDPNFFVGQGQPACLSCHGGGAASLTHGYATLADLFDFDNNSGGDGLIYQDPTTVATQDRKSLGSNSGIAVTSQRVT